MRDGGREREERGKNEDYFIIFCLRKEMDSSLGLWIKNKTESFAMIKLLTIPSLTWREEIRSYKMYSVWYFNGAHHSTPVRRKKTVSIIDY